MKKNIPDTLIIDGKKVIENVKFLEVKSTNKDELKSWFSDGILPVLGQKVDIICTHVDSAGFCLSLKTSGGSVEEKP